MEDRCFLTILQNRNENLQVIQNTNIIGIFHFYYFLNSEVNLIKD